MTTELVFFVEAGADGARLLEAARSVVPDALEIDALMDKLTDDRFFASHPTMLYIDKPGADAEAVAAALRDLLPWDVLSAAEADAKLVGLPAG